MSELTLQELGLSSESSSTLPAEHAGMLAATLDVAFDPSQPLPLLWHWAFFNPAVETAELGPDGHPRRDGPVAAEFPRRMWVGGEVRAEGPLHADVDAVRRTRLLRHDRKHGSSGDLVVVALEHIVEQGGRAVVVERQDVIYRQAGGVTAAAGPAVTLPPAAGWRETLQPNSTLLFRFSAVTFNGHRIHYDHEYATQVEHYPGLVVHGPLTAMVLAGSAARHLNAPLQSFSYRATSPLFVDQPVAVDGALADVALADVALADGGTATMTATRVDGAVAMTAVATAQTAD